MGANSRRRREKRAQREQNPVPVTQDSILVADKDESLDLFAHYQISPSPHCPPHLKEDHRYIMNAMLDEYHRSSRAVGIMAATKAWHDCYDNFASSLPKELPSAHDNRVHLRVACEAGCNHCCVLPVVATPPEVAFIAQVVTAKFSSDERAALKQRIADRDAAIRGRSSRRHMCPLNVEGKCSVYGVRPFNCRTYHSFDVNACVSNFRLDQPVDVPFDPLRKDQPNYLFSASADLVFTGLKLDVRGVDLADALGIALGTERVLDRLAEGEDIFAAARVPV